MAYDKEKHCLKRKGAHICVLHPGHEKKDSRHQCLCSEKWEEVKT